VLIARTIIGRRRKPGQFFLAPFELGLDVEGAFTKRHRRHCRHDERGSGSVRKGREYTNPARAVSIRCKVKLSLKLIPTP